MKNKKLMNQICWKMIKFSKILKINQIKNNSYTKIYQLKKLIKNQ